MTVDTSNLTRVGRNDLLRIIEELKEENAGLRVQAKLDRVDELQASMSKMVNNSLARRVRAFHLKFDHPVVWTPAVPSEKQVKFRLNLISEEFFELLSACEIWPTVIAFNESGKEVEISVWEAVKNAIENDFIDPKVIDLPEFVDALGDMEWVIEGTRAVFGVDGAPVMNEINRANMAKEATQVAEKDAFHKDATRTRIKPTKPEGWKPPDIAGCLLTQGWEP